MPSKDGFSKKQILSSKQFKPTERDLLKALLDGNKKYSIADAKKILQSELKRKVK